LAGSRIDVDCALPLAGGRVPTVVAVSGGTNVDVTSSLAGETVAEPESAW
jgi:hypothetical protein